MHGSEGGGQKNNKRKRTWHMWSVSSSTTTTTSVAAAFQSTTPSVNSFFKDVRKINVGDCALFKPPHNSPLFIGIIRSVASDKENNLKLEVNWLYRPGEVKLSKGVALEAAPNEVFYSFHRDEIPAASLLHPCKVAFLPKGVELPSGVSSFVCRRVYDITNKCLWWLTDKDYINGRQEEVDQLLSRTRSEMHATMQQQQGGRSPKPMNGPTAASQFKNTPETLQTSTGSFPSQSKGKKRERSDQAPETLKRERVSRSDDGEASQKAESMLKSEISRITERGGLVNFEGVERLVQLIQPGKNEKKLDWSSRSLLAGVIASTDRFDCLSRFVQLRGLVVLDEWLQEVHKGKVGDSSSPKDSDKSVEEFLLVLLRALDKLPVNLNALQACNIGKSVNNLRSHRNSEIQKKARSLVDTWKKRVEVEMNFSDAKSGSGQAVPWTARSKPDGSHGGNRQTAGSSDAAIRSSFTQLSSSKSASAKNVLLESNGKSAGASPGSLKSTLPASPSATFRDGQPRLSVAGMNPELPQIVTKDEKSSGSSQSHTNSQCSSEHGKNLVSSGKEDARSSTAGSTSMTKISGSASRYRRSPNSVHGASSCVSQREVGSGRNSVPAKTSASDKSSPPPLTCEKTIDAPAAEVNNYKLIVKIQNRGRSPAQSIIGGNIEDPSFMSSRASSPLHSEKHDQSCLKLKDNIDAYRTTIASDVNTESWESNDMKDVGSDEGNGSPVVAPDCDHCGTANDLAKPADAGKPALASSGHEAKPTKAHDASFSSINALIEASDNALIADDVGMNLLASVAVKESSKSGIESPTDFPPNATMEPCPDCNGISQVNEDDRGSHSSTSEKELGQNEDKCIRSSGKYDDLVGAASLPIVETAAGIEEFHEKKTFLKDEIHEFAAERQTNCSIVSTEIKDCSSPKQETQKTTEASSSSCLAENVDDDKKDPNRGMNSNPIAEHKTFEVVAVSEPIMKNEEASATSASIIRSPPRRSNDLKVEETMIESVDASGGVDQGVKQQSNDEENASSQTPLKVDEAHVGLAVTETKSVYDIEKLSGKGDSGISLGKLSSRKDSNVLATEEPSTSSKGPQLEAVEGIALEERMSSDATSSASVPLGISDIEGKLGFDLNEGLNMDDTKCIESVGVATSIRLLGPVSSFSAPSTSTVLPAFVTIAAAAKGPFVPPEDLLRNKGELGWKGSAATSAFRPAEPRRFSETPLGNGSIQHVDPTSSKQARPPLEFDLNVADERILEDNGCQNSTPGNSDNNIKDLLIGGQTGTATSLRCSGGIDLDLNKVDEVAEPGYQSNIRRFEAPHPSAGPSSVGGGSSNVRSSRRNFDLNNGPAVDEVVAEPSVYNQARANLIIQPPVRINNVDIGSLSSWYPPVSSYSAVPIPSLLPDQGEQRFPVVGVSGGPQRIVGGPSVSTQFTLETFRGPVLSSSAALPFPSTTFQYPVFPFGTSIPLPSTTFSGGSSAYMDLSSGGRFCIPAVPSHLIGTTSVSSQYPRPYVVTFPDISNPAGDSSRKFARQGLDLNAGQDVEGRDETVQILSRQVPNSNSISLAEEQARMYHLAGNVLKRKEPDSGWDGDRLSFKQTSLK